MRRILIIAVAVALGGATECGQVISDRGFDLWCGERLCSWDLEKGEIRRVATWNEGDSGVEMIGDDVAISQLAPAETSDGRCVRVTMVADIEESAEVRLQLDVYGDGTVESDERIPTSDWRKLTYLLRLPDTYQGVRFRLTKRGGGRAVLANIGAEIVIDEACMGEPLAVTAPVGAYCEDDGDCGSGQCFEWLGDWPDVCGSCDGDEDCTGGDLCTVAGPAPGWLSVYSQCMPPGALADGLRCLRDENCASGICGGGVCSECRTAADCGGAACVPTEVGATRCDRGRGAGATCFVHGDCDSGVCEGEALLGCDGALRRECASESDCPGQLSDPDAISCVTVGFAGGICR